MRCDHLMPSTSGTVDEREKDELAALVLRGCCEDGRSRAKNMPPHGDAIHILANVHAKSVDQG